MGCTGCWGRSPGSSASRSTGPSRPASFGAEDLQGPGQEPFGGDTVEVGQLAEPEEGDGALGPLVSPDHRGLEPASGLLGGLPEGEPPLLPGFTEGPSD